MKFKIYNYKAVRSTNDVAMFLIKKKKKDSGCVCAQSQNRGRGTHGKKWISKKGNLFTTIFFPLKKKYPPFSEFVTINSLIIAKVIKKFCNKSTVSLKFPNDIFVNNKKICGVLQEIITFKEKKFLIIGIGLNVLSNPKLSKRYKSTSIFVESKIKLNKSVLLKRIILSYEIFFKNLRNYNFDKLKIESNLMSIKL